MELNPNICRCIFPKSTDAYNESRILTITRREAGLTLRIKGVYNYRSRAEVLGMALLTVEMGNPGLKQERG